jgi:Domain of unknown function (DUF1844)
VSDEKREEELFKVIDRRPFTAEGELRKEVVAEQEREAERDAIVQAAKEERQAANNAAAAGVPVEKAGIAAVPAVPTPKRSEPFENLVRMIGSNAAMVLGAYADPRTGQPVLDPDAARELIDMLDALQEKTKGNLAPEEESMLLDLLGKLKMTYLEINKAMAEQMAQVAAQAKTGKVKA